MLKVADPAFAVACISGLSDVHECSGGLQMATSPKSRWPAVIHWLMSLVMDLAALCDTYMEVQMAPMDAIRLFSALT